MESVFGRYRNLTILVGVLFLQVLGLAVQVKRTGDAEHTRLIRIWAVDMITPFERGLLWAQNGVDNIWHNYFFLRGVRAENRQLKEQIEQLRLQQVRLNEDAAQAHRLQSLLAFKEQFVAKTVPAQVIGSSASDLSRSIYIDKGSDAGVSTDMPVITAGGIVGKVLRVYPSTSLVLMINDQSSGVGVLLEKSRLQGVLHGTPDGELLVDRVMSDEQVAAGDIVLSSGGDQIFPKGLAVGTVSAVSPGKELFLKIKVKSAADLSRLEEVLVVTDKEEQAPVTELGSKVRAADILAQRLPSVPDQPKPVVPAASTANGASHPGTNVDAKPLTSGAAKPATATVPNAVAAGGSNKVAGSNGSGSMAAGQRAAGASVSVVSKPRPSTVSHSTSSTTSSSASSPASNSANSPAASASAQPAPAKQSLAKPANPQASSQPAATEDTPH